MATVEVPSDTVAYELHGAGDPLVLVAGTGYPGATWPPAVVQALAGRHTVLTFDHRGTGETPPGRQRYSTRGFATDAVGLLDALDLPAAHVVGHSMGGRVAQWMALDHPERVRSLILAATGPGQFSDDRPVTRGIPVHTALELIELGYAGYMAEHIARTFFTPEFVAAEPERVDWLIRAFWDHRPTLEEYLRHVVARQEHQTADRLGDIRMPTLVLVGDRDTHVAGTGVHRDQSTYLAERIAGSTFVVLPDVTHGYFWQDPQATVAALLEWTAGH
jgi:pimeloyl-ACP methyl ester carboxylesterase